MAALALHPELCRFPAGVIEGVDDSAVIPAERAKFVYRYFFLDHGKPCLSSISGEPKSHSRSGLIAMHKIKKAKIAKMIAPWINLTSICFPSRWFVRFEAGAELGNAEAPALDKSI
jgi:hypothetical protein